MDHELVDARRMTSCSTKLGFCFTDKNEILLLQWQAFAWHHHNGDVTVMMYSSVWTMLNR